MLANTLTLTKNQKIPLRSSAEKLQTNGQIEKQTNGQKRAEN